jgi:hypothetical protein
VPSAPFRLALQALGIAAVKAVVCIVGITAGGRLLIRPLYKKISGLANAEIFAATTLLVVLGTSFMTQLAGAACRRYTACRRGLGAAMHTTHSCCMLALHSCYHCRTAGVSTCIWQQGAAPPVT